MLKQIELEAWKLGNRVIGFFQTDEQKAIVLSWIDSRQEYVVHYFHTDTKFSCGYYTRELAAARKVFGERYITQSSDFLSPILGPDECDYVWMNG